MVGQETGTFHYKTFRNLTFKLCDFNVLNKDFESSDFAKVLAKEFCCLFHSVGLLVQWNAMLLLLKVTITWARYKYREISIK